MSATRWFAMAIVLVISLYSFVVDLGNEYMIGSSLADAATKSSIAKNIRPLEKTGLLDYCPAGSGAGASTRNGGSVVTRSLAPGTIKIRFTQMWSTGHVGTRFLRDLLTRSEIHVSNETYDPFPQFIYFEHELPMMTKTESPYKTLSRYKFKKLMREKTGARGKYGPRIKEWNFKGNKIALQNYLERERMPALWSVYNQFNHNNPNRTETINHFIKIGHTAVFFDLSDYYKVLSSTEGKEINHDTNKTTPIRIETDFVRIKRRRVDAAISFTRAKRKGPEAAVRRRVGLLTSPSMKTALLKFDSIGGPLPEATWNNWTVFQQYLWYVDEVEARWRVFLEEHPEVKYFELAFRDVTDDDLGKQELVPSELDDLAVNYLNLGCKVSQYMNGSGVGKHSHKNSGNKKMDLTSAEKERQANEYSRHAPWCLQYEGKEASADDRQKYPKLDCNFKV